LNIQDAKDAKRGSGFKISVFSFGLARYLRDRSGITNVEKLKFFDAESPSHMDKGSRNARLADWLAGIGLYVQPVIDPAHPRTSASPSAFDYLIVSVGIPAKRVQTQDQG
jgi:hypothetical protein